MTRKPFPTGLLAVAAILVGPAFADDFDEARDALCDKTRSCAMARMESAENMSDEMKEMMASSLESMCDGLEQTFNSALRTHELYEPALACMQEMAEMECDSLMGEGARKSEACQRYRALAEQ